MTLTPGMLLLHEKYRVESLLGAGAFAEVYRVLHLQLNAPRALKILHRDAAGLSSTEFGDYRTRFELEAQLGAQLHHPHVIDVHDFEEEAGTLMLIMELAPGGSLADRIKKARSEGHPLGVEECITIAREIAEGLSALHFLEAVHRDVKPSNILFDVQGQAKLADLGLAQVPHGGSMRALLSTPLRHPGTPAYMSPEQRDTGDPLKPPSDVYALGCVLFEMLTGRIYYNQRPGTRARGLRPEIDSGLDDLLARMLAGKAGDRPWDGAEAAELLREAARNRAEEKQRQQQEEERRAQEAKNQEEELRARVRSLMDEGRQASERKEYALAISKWDEARKLSPTEPGLDAAIEKARQNLLEEEGRELEIRQAEQMKRQREAEERRRADEEKRLEEEKTRGWESKRERLKQKVIQALDWALPKETEAALNDLANHLGSARDSDPDFSDLQGQLESLKAELFQKEEEKRRVTDERRRKKEEEAVQARLRAEEQRKEEEPRKEHVQNEAERYAQAVWEARRIREEEAKKAAAGLAAALYFLDRGAFVEAEARLQEALSLDPANAEAKAALARCRDEKAAAEERSRHAQDKNVIPVAAKPNYGRWTVIGLLAVAMIVVVIWSIGTHQGGEITPGPQPPVNQDEIARQKNQIRTYLDAHNWDAAGKGVNALLKIAPNDPDAAAWQNQISAAVEAGRKAAEISALKKQARDSINGRDWNGAGEKFANILKLAPNDPDAIALRKQVDREIENARSAPEVKPTPNSIGIEFVAIPAGKFMMGCSPGDKICSPWVNPRHEVTISRGFELGKYEVTQGQWVRVMGNNPSNFKGDDRLPVEEVSWGDAQAFIVKLNALNDGYRYRLPTEAEWEYAARGGTAGPYYGNLDEIAWYNSNSGNKTHPVGQKQPNGFGLYDMLGNVSEWCADWFDESYYGSSPAADPKGPASGLYRVERFGSWVADSWGSRVSERGGDHPDSRTSSNGFRVCREKL